MICVGLFRHNYPFVGALTFKSVNSAQMIQIAVYLFHKLSQEINMSHCFRFVMDMIDMPVTLIVKAPNQQIEDQTIHCELNWTIRKLKGYLSEVYPSKPVSFNLVNFNFLKSLC